MEVAADLTRHQKAVNVVRWAPSGRLLASGDDEAIIFIWKQNAEKEPAPASLEQGDEQYKESWIILKVSFVLWKLLLGGRHAGMEFALHGCILAAKNNCISSV